MEDPRRLGIHIVPGPDPRPDLDTRALLVKWRLGDEVHHPVGRVGTVQCRTRTQRHLDPVQIEIVGRDHVVGVEPERRHVSVPVVGQDEKGPGEDVVESPGDGAAALAARLADVHPR